MYNAHTPVAVLPGVARKLAASKPSDAEKENDPYANCATASPALAVNPLSFSPRFLEETGHPFKAGANGKVRPATLEGKKLAIKIIPIPPNSLSKNIREVAERENKNAAKAYGLPAIPIFIKRSDQKNAKIYLSLPWIDGEELSNLIDLKNPLQNFLLLISAAIALNKLHRLNLVHGDVKPENCLALKNNTNYEAQWVDFGFSTDLDDPSQHLSYGGTKPYFAPEILLRHPAGKASDVFSFCCMLAIHLGFLAKDPAPGVIISKGGSLKFRTNHSWLSEKSTDQLIALLEQGMSANPSDRMSSRFIKTII